MENPALKIEKKFFTERELPELKNTLTEITKNDTNGQEQSKDVSPTLQRVFERFHQQQNGRTLHSGRYKVFNELSQLALQFAELYGLDVEIRITERLEGFICFTGNAILIECSENQENRLMLSKFVIVAKEFSVCPDKIGGYPVVQMTFMYELFKPVED